MYPLFDKIRLPVHNGITNLQRVNLPCVTLLRRVFRGMVLQIKYVVIISEKKNEQDD